MKQKTGVFYQIKRCFLPGRKYKGWGVMFASKIQTRVKKVFFTRFARTFENLTTGLSTLQSRKKSVKSHVVWPPENGDGNPPDG
jgi:hypothetical protein